MPTIVIVGNSSHTVYYKKEGFAPSHEPQIKAAIDQALGISSGVDELNEETTRLFPNPAKDHITIETGTGSDRVLIRDMLGRVVLKEKVTADSRTIDLTALKKGFYTISVLKNGSVTGVKVFSKE